MTLCRIESEPLRPPYKLLESRERREKDRENRKRERKKIGRDREKRSIVERLPYLYNWLLLI